MDAGSLNSCPQQVQFLQRWENLDRFIPNRSAMDFDFAHYMLTERGKGKENQSVVRSQSKEAYLKLLAETFNMNRSRILAFKNKPPTPNWKNHILTTGGMDGQIINNDVRVHSHIVATFRGHRQEVCGLKWSTSGQQLASGGNDNLLYIWDRSMASMHSRSQWLHRLEDHTAAVKALAWCPFQRNLLASGGGGSDGCIKFWNIHTGACLNSVDTAHSACSVE
ncbi:hypothetical protein AAG906_012381 [Vitis piasezkii]